MCDRSSHFFSLDELRLATKLRSPDARFLAIDFNQWEPHVMSSLKILNFLAQSGFKCFYDQTHFGFFPKFGKPYFGRQTCVQPKWLLKNQMYAPVRYANSFISDLIDSEMSNLMLESISSVSDRRGLTGLRKNDFEYGYALVSSLASTFGRSELNTGIIRRYAPSLLEDYIKTVNDVYKVIIINQITHLIVFNGRFVKESAAICAAKAAGISIVYHEASKSGKFYVSCYSPLSSVGYLELTRFWTNKKNPKEISDVATTWFKNRMTGQDLDSSAFQKKWLPLKDSDEEKRSERKQIVIFTTSDDEFLGVSPDWDLPESQSQIEWLTKIAVLATSFQYKVVIRLHPNLRTKSRSLQREWSNLRKLKNVELIKHGESINSYNLINQSDLIISCGSTIAMEAGFLGKPVLSVGSGVYDSLHAVTKSQDLSFIEKIFIEANFDSIKPIKSKIEVYGFTETSKFENFEKNIFISKTFLEDEFFKPSMFNRIVSRIYRDIVFRFNMINR
jgi:hypothetical protein